MQHDIIHHLPPWDSGPLTHWSDFPLHSKRCAVLCCSPQQRPERKADMKRINCFALIACAAYMCVCSDAYAQSPKVTVYGAIRDKWLAMGGGSGKLRQPVGNEQPTFDNVGR